MPIRPFADSSEQAYNRTVSSSPARLAAVRQQEIQAAAFTEAEILHKNDTAMLAKVMTNTKSILGNNISGLA